VGISLREDWWWRLRFHPLPPSPPNPPSSAQAATNRGLPPMAATADRRKSKGRPGFYTGDLGLGEATDGDDHRHPCPWPRGTHPAGRGAMRSRERRRRPLLVAWVCTVTGRGKGNSPLADGWVPPVSEGKEREGRRALLGCDVGR
jgi:hypothetical protein